MNPNPVPRKYNIFLSSSFRDLKEARRECILEILRIDQIPNGMEMFHAGFERNLEIIERAISACDIFVMLVGARYGELVSTKEAVPYTEWEFRTAQRMGKPIIVFLLQQHEYDEVRKQIGREDPEYKHHVQLDEFRKKVQMTTEDEGKRIVEFFSYHELGSLHNKLSDAIHTTIPSIQGGGWVPGKYYDELAEKIRFDITVSENPFFQRFAERMSQFKKLSSRTIFRKESKHALARYFWRRYLSAIALGPTRRLFFESGSTIAYLSEEFIAQLGQARWGGAVCKKLRIATNNILTFLDFALIPRTADPFDVSLLPKGAFESDYGATFGDLAEAIELASPNQPRSLHSNAKPFVESEIKKFKEFFNEPGLILMTASGIEADTGSPFFGPHVGSYYNELVKRCLLSLENIPIVMFLDSAKVPYSFRVGNCYPVCGPDFTWNQLAKDLPLAVMVAADTKEARDACIRDLGNLGLTNQDPIAEEGGIWPVIATNEMFDKATGGWWSVR